MTLFAPALERVGGPFRIRTMRRLTCVLPNLTAVEQDLELAVVEVATLDLQGLQSVGRSLIFRAWDAPAALDLRALRSVGVDLILRDGAGLRALDLPALEQVGMGQGDGLGDLRVISNFDLADIRVPRLEQVAGAIEIRDNPELSPQTLSERLSGVQSSSRTVCGNGGAEPCAR